MKWLSELSHTTKARSVLIYAIVSAALLTFLFFCCADIAVEEHRLTDRLETMTLGMNDNLPPAIVAADRPLARSLLDAFRRETAVRAATLYDAEGNLFVHLPLALGPTPHDERLPAALVTNSENKVRSLSFSELQVLVPITVNGEHAGTVQLDVDLMQLYSPVKATGICLALAMLISGMSAFALSVRLDRRLIAGPFNRFLNRTRQAWEAQNFAARISIKSDDDIGAFGHVVNQMFEELEKRGTELSALRGELEARVRERTLRLDAAVVDVQETLERTEAASRAKSEFLARMSHEIRTPMNAVLGMTELLRHATTLDDRQRRYADVIHQSGSALLGIINDILDFSKIEAGKLELDIAPFSLRDVVEDAVEILAEKSHSKGLELICDIPAEVETAVFGDGQRLRQIIINLVGNAVKFTELGEVRVTVRHSVIDRHRSQYRFEVTDTGIGINPQSSAAIFESFAQEDNSTTRKYGGTGLGLAICRQLVELMGGEMGVNSVLGEGSTFYFTVELPNDPATVRGMRPAVLKGTRVLVIDDNMRARQIVVGHLKSWGVEVTEAKSGPVALQLLEIAQGGAFQALIVDAQMPKFNGFVLVKEIRSRPQYEHVPILMLMSVSLGTGSEESLEGPVGWISKPVRRAHLHSSLVSLFTSEPATAPALTRVNSKRLTVLSPRPRETSRIHRVLLVEDNPVNQEMTRAMLLELGIETASAWSGEEALVKMAAESFDVVLMDCQMPKLDGYATTRRVREWERRTARERTPIVAVTANALNGDAARCFEAGMDRYLSKPFTIEQLFGILESCVPESPPLRQEQAAQPDDESAESTTVATLDAQTLEQIRQLERGVPNLLSKISDLYLANSAVLLTELRRAIQAGDPVASAKAVHSLKSTSYNAGAKELAEICGNLEAQCLESRFNEARLTLDYVIREHGRVKRALTALRAAA